jgi:AraC-type DNA-binding domain-containing proteins
MGNQLFNIFPNENFVDLGLYQYGWESCEPLHSFGPHIRNHYLFHYVISGTGKLVSKDSRGIDHEYIVKSGQGFLICPKQTNTYFADEEHPWEYAWIEFDGLRVKEMLNLAGLSFDSPLYRSNAKDLSYELKNEMLYIVQHPKESAFHLIGHLYLALDLLTRSSANRITIKSGKLIDFYVHEALSFIEQNFQNDITVEDIADWCNLNRSYFGKIFRNAVGKSPQEFLISYRMTKAAELLKLTELSIRDISNAVGYPNQLHFSRAFKNVYDVSPRKWRLENKIIKS